MTSLGFEMGRNGLTALRGRYTSLAAWQASTWLLANTDDYASGSHPGGGDLVSNPQFVNASGTLTQLADFSLKSTSPCRGSGRNGVDMGADITKVGYHDAAGAIPPTSKPVLKTP